MLKTDVSIRPADVCRTAVLALLVALLTAAPSAAQTSVVADPGFVEFTPSADHSEPYGSVSLVSGYVLRLYQVGVSQPFHEMNIGKPAPGSDGQIHVDLANSVSSWPAPGGTYEARVAAVGPGGEGVSDPSNPFTLSSCAVTLSDAGALFAAVGGGGAVSITTGTGCSWTATATAPWVTMATSSGTGSGSAIFSVAANTATVARTASVMVGNLAYRVDQEAACAYSISSTGRTFSAAGGTASVGITAGSGCTWTASSGLGWIVVSLPGGGTGNGSVAYQVAANTGAARTGTLAIAGVPHTVSQDAAVTTPPPPPPPPPSLPAPWQGQDIGAVGVAGTASYSNGVFTVSGAGTGISGTLDSFYSVSQPLGTATSITARITALGAGSQATAGVMFRDGTAANAPQVSLLVRPGGIVEFVQRTAAGGTTAVRGSTTQALPTWVRLVKNGSKVTASVSADGQTWRAIGTRPLNSKKLQVGLAAASLDTARLTTVTADNVVVK